MTMKKRFLGLALAAMVAVPATTAYANTITGPDTSPLTQNVKVSGTVKKKDGTAPEGKIEVELPTTLSFTVDQKGNVRGADYSVTNNSSKAVIVAVQSFTDTTGDENITVKKSGEVQPGTDKRSIVALSLVGTPVPGSDNATTVDLKAITPNTGDDILGVQPGATSTMTLNGIAGTQDDSTVDANGVSDEFNLVFNIRAQN